MIKKPSWIPASNPPPNGTEVIAWCVDADGHGDTVTAIYEDGHYGLLDSEFSALPGTHTHWTQRLTGPPPDSPTLPQESADKPGDVLADFFRIALFNTVPDDLRRGQYASNVLSRMHPDISKAIADTAVDPFYFDDRMPEFLARVAVLWQKAEPFEPEITLTTCASCGKDPRPSEVIVAEDRDLEAPDSSAEPVPVKMLQYEPAGQAQGWMTVGLGTRFNPLDLKPEDINVADIARALSRLPRYGGHGHRTMSVAEHCVLLTEWVEKVASGADLEVPSDEMLAVLHHDDEEAYICDMPRPIKHGVPGLLAIYEALADKILDAIHAHLGIERWEKTAIYDLAKDLDRRVVFAELPALFATDPGWQPGDAEGYEPEFWGAEEAEMRFLAAHEAWGGTVPPSPERAGS